MVGSITATGTSDTTGAAPPRQDAHTVHAGDTLSAIARRHGTDVATLARINGLRDPDVIAVGQRLELPGGASAGYTIARGDTLTAIARRHGTDVAAIVAANPQLGHPDHLYPGDRLTLPAPRAEAPTATAVVGGTTRVADGTLSLSAADVTNLKKTLQTEWVQGAGEAQAHGIIDTILNRTASGHWGGTVADVVDSYNQFSDINGPIARRAGRNSVEDLPASSISARVDRLVDGYLAERAGGRESSIGSHLNYANPHYSSANNRGWINALDGPVLGRGDAVHHHGTVPELDRYRPGAFALALPGTAAAPAPATPAAPPAAGHVDGRAVAAANGVAVKSEAVRIDRLDAAMEPAIRAAATAAQRLGLPTPVITSGNDSRHSNGSLHYHDQALDFRGNNITVAQGQALQAEVRELLGDRYDVVFETFANRGNNHLHVEYDPD
ncbi:LysM peptidoglycan-binding domain-containing protein [Sphingomonas sp. BK235]|uniref:LysM peptidoglycan-binding domain-containing protein n=1 Tax=Sphingomonas sp. BK235 TaxID=2512131 RepID=UPI0010DC67D2|nr:LysM peptidoglycan-binding domain-containing protein [Sphingomonas sp. BK235]TCP34368.1 LysM repeat protein [Sphingomonas sp. BK235]